MCHENMRRMRDARGALQSDAADLKGKDVTLGFI